MNAEQKQQAKQLIADWTNVSKTSTPAVWFLNGDCMAGFLQELIDAPEPEPVAYLIDWPDEPEFGHCLSEEPNDSGRSRPLYTAPTPAEAPADVARDAERWRTLPQFLEEFQIPYLRLIEKIDAAIERQGGE